MDETNDSTKQDTIDKALELATTGDPTEAIRLLWPVMLDHSQRDQAMFALAFCFEKAQNFSTAHYLYEEIALRYPEFITAVDRQQACHRVVIEKGLIEDFMDMGHRLCDACTLRFRSEYMLCPYCGNAEKQKKSSGKEEVKPDTEKVLPDWEDESLLDTLQGMGRDAANKIQDIVESDTVQNISEGVSKASQVTVQKAKEWSEGETAQGIKKHSAKLGDDVLNKAQEISEKPAVRDLAQKIEDLSTKASDKVSQVMEKDSTKHAKLRTQRFGKKVMRHIRKAMNPDKKDD